MLEENAEKEVSGLVDNSEKWKWEMLEDKKEWKGRTEDDQIVKEEKEDWSVKKERRKLRMILQ